MTITADRNRNSKISNMLNQSQSYSSFQQFTTDSSPTETVHSSISSSNWSCSLHKPPARHTTNDAGAALSTTSSTISTGSFSKRFHSSHLGRPPGLSSSNNRLSSQLQQQKPPKLSTSSSYSSLHQQNHNSIQKIAPMKEVEKMIADLKKENFDLKLRLYHLEDLMNKDLDLYQLNEENNRLKMNLEDRNRHLEGLEREISLVLQQQQQQVKKTVSCSIGTQTQETIPITPTSTLDSYHTAFESSPEAFGLLPVSKSTFALHSPSKNNKQNSTDHIYSWQKIRANEDHLSVIVSQLQNFKLMEEETTNDNNIDFWLSQNVNNHQQGNLRHPSYYFTK